MCEENQASFLARLAPVLAPSEILKVRGAYYMSKYGHRGQTRKEPGPDGLPLRYFEHARRVTLRLIDYLHFYDVDGLCTSLLHDAVEDTREIDEELIEFFFGPDVARMVLQLSKKPKEGYHERLDACSDWRVLAIKLVGDRWDNLLSLETTEPTFQRKQIAETGEIYLPMFLRLLELAPVAYRSAITEAQQELTGIVINYARRFSVEGP